MLKSALIALSVSSIVALPALAQTEARQLFGSIPVPSQQPAEPIGSYTLGCMAGAVELPETGPSWQAMRLSRGRNFGQPELISFIERLGAAAQQAGWAGIYVGDISQPRGGPMLTGHRSHQIGLDADIWMLPPDRLNLTRAERENISSISIRSEDQRDINSNWTEAHFEVMRAAASDPAVARIFVTAAVKQHMCEVATGDRSWLRTIRPWWGHHYHFHVRLACPAGATNCQDQAPPPPGDGCDETLAWWTSDEALNPPPPDPNAPPAPPRQEYVMADLPQQCTGVLYSQ
ncbi:penicillin-insensitive murein endopeptidase [Pontivivens insulae]|uniref:Penicillin-insensitive murein endopeptidase n=1 Tax=Pontivivens insulae TaxID=1639689 RepID=A0A2R8AA36_9RHOB|nr:penicillin-insensitive murein endopeptidase [Pontivivens insulae]RED13005.1 penicillin-insensitive murein endopeptidase [Pontivivens insulae]SPF29097.1 Penicillin-insensitive murein endopeptidase [Pontivivens insulae]